MYETFHGRCRCCGPIAWLAVLVAPTFAAEEVGVRVPAGFEATVYAGDDLAHDIFSLTIDARGRVVVAGAGYVKTLHDDNGDGRADRAVQFSDVPRSGAHGMCFDGHDLLCTGDNAVMLLHDRDGNGIADGPPETWAKLGHAEHGANGLVRGPDGWFYLICGNDAGVNKSHSTTPTAPVREPQCGAVVRFSPDGRQSEVVAHGFRNPYDLDFDAAGRMWTVDADGERDQYLPWYAPTRLFDVTPGMHHGWMLAGWQRSWNRPAAYFDNVERTAEIGRGSPTGVKVYRHRQFPASYRNQAFACCWTLGRVYRFALQPHGSTCTTQTEVFLETVGEVGFAPVGLDVAPDGDLFVAIGGRGTRGSVLRIRYVGEGTTDEKLREELSPLESVLQADEPLTAWSRARWAPLADKLGAAAFTVAALDESRDSADRVRAIEVLVDRFDGLPLAAAEKLAADENAAVAARTAWALGRRPLGEKGAAVLAALTRSKEPTVARAAWESLEVSADRPRDLTFPATAADRKVRLAAWRVAARWKVEQQVFAGDDPPTVIARLASASLGGRLQRSDFAAAAAAFIASSKSNSSTSPIDARQRLDAVRLMQIALGDMRIEPQQLEVFAGYARGDAAPLSEAERPLAERLADQFPTGDAELDRELARLLGMLGQPNPLLAARLAEKFTADSRVEDDIHYLIVLARLGTGERAEVARRAASALLALHGKMAAASMYPSRNWPLRVGEIVRSLPLAEVLVNDPQFHLPAHAALALQLPRESHPAAARKLLAAIARADETEAESELRWTPELVQLIATLPPDESLPALRGAWDDFTLRDDIARVLVRHSEAVDRGRLIEALASTQPDVVEGSAHSLAKQADEATIEEVAAALAALRQACYTPQQKPQREALTELLMHWKQGPVATPEGSDADPLRVFRAWLAWFATAHPEAAGKLAAFGANPAEWNERVAGVNWDAGDAERGRSIYEKRACFKCHAGNARLGPDLAGVTGRLSRSDLLAAIVDPSRDVSPTYQTTQLVTGNGKVYQGLVVYESPESTLIQTSPETTIRVAGEEIVSLRKSRQSLMPTGLLDGIRNEDLADLFAFLKTIKPRR